MPTDSFYCAGRVHGCRQTPDCAGRLRIAQTPCLGTNFGEILIWIRNYSFTKIHMKISSAKWQPFCSRGDELMGVTRDDYTVKTNALKKTCCVNFENHIFPNISIFKTCHVYLDIGSNIYLGELSVGHRASISCLSCRIICAVVKFQHVESVSRHVFFINTLSKHFFNMLKRLDCRKDALNYNFFDSHI